jgi:tRNA pseudouridine55 synthase
LTDSGLAGLLVVDKPKGITSHDVVARVRRIAGTRRVGHTGTLDPMATGVLVLCLGKATRLIPFIEEQKGDDAKEYVAGIRFGFETTTDDAEGEPRTPLWAGVAVTEAAVTAALNSMVGEISQVPPVFSAKKIAGERAYALARRGDEVNLEPAMVTVRAAELQELAGDDARVRFVCSRGTYIRALARDLGRAVGAGAHLIALRRTRSGTATLERAVTLEGLTPERLVHALVPMAEILEDWPKVTVDEGGVTDLKQGRAVNQPRGVPLIEGRVRVCDRPNDLVALAAAEGARLRPFCVF